MNLCLDEEGETSDERRENILKSLYDMPPMARQAVEAEMRYLMQELDVLNTTAVRGERAQKSSARGN